MAAVMAGRIEVMPDMCGGKPHISGHRAEIDASIRADEAFVAELRRRTPSQVMEKLRGRAN